MTSPTKNKPQT